jgi:bifunctional DNase/RNase
MKLVELEIKGISYSETQSGTYALILQEIDGNRKLPIVIGGFEAQSIAIALDEDIKPSRPLTHDLFKSFADRFEVMVKQIIIHKLVDGVFYSSMICERNKIEEIIDARTSDAIAMALRFGAPVFTYDAILKRAGFTTTVTTSKAQNPEDENWVQNWAKSGKKSSELPTSLKRISTAKLKTLLKKFVHAEDYEKAAVIRDEITKREA